MNQAGMNQAGMNRTGRSGAVRGNVWRNLLCSAAVGLALAACASVPGSGPRTADIENGATTSGPYVLIDVDQNAAQRVSAYAVAQRAEAPIVLPTSRGPGLVGAGDLLRVAIWEPNQNGTSLTADKSGLETIARVEIDGTIGVPYVGRVPVAGHTPAQIEADLRARLASQSPAAQVAVLVTEDLTNNVIVQGDVGKPGRYPVVPNSSGLLDILAMAGGAHTPDHQTTVRITRAGTSFTRTLSSVTAAHALERDLAPGDRILVEPRAAYFYAFGAVNRPGEQLYDADTISLARMLARLEGLADSRADPAEVFIYRRQEAELTRAVARTATAPGQDLTRVIYRVNLRDPGGFFVSQAFPVLPDDLVYVSESPIAEVAKVFQVLTGVSAIGAIPHNLGVPY
jgi:polysaccharide export outer membrane protein